MGSKIYPEVHENPRAFFSSSNSILLEPLAHGSDLDIVRRDWSLLAKELAHFCLTQILSGGSCEDVMESIHNSLM
ncbi:DNA polymerase alpha catalytic subunit [Glycine soja]|uniref:DNA-directed DNA polymerase n=1 Tax=Glycine soja TaxID=3848 RepID=A0A445KLH6_GLYSO|nr:DNA polymerase alpha catalytic subunit [Glycine soja]